jgi:hypothetical protein
MHNEGSQPTPQKSSLKYKKLPAKQFIECAAKASEPAAAQMKEGEFDEDASHKSFLEALNSWRGNGAAEDAASEKKSVRFE